MIKRLSGIVETGCGDAKNWGVAEIREVSGYTDLKPGTLNIRLPAPYDVRCDFALPREARKDGSHEDLYLERCFLLIGPQRVKALIARTSTNHWQSSVLELMAEEMLRERYGIKDGDVLDVEVWAEL